MAKDITMKEVADALRAVRFAKMWSRELDDKTWSIQVWKEMTLPGRYILVYVDRGEKRRRLAEDVQIFISLPSTTKEELLSSVSSLRGVK